MIVAEGVLEYLTAEEVKMPLNRLTDYFSHGVITFDVMNPLRPHRPPTGLPRLAQKYSE